MRIFKVGILAVLLVLAGCAGMMPKPKFDPNDPTNSVIFGYVDTTDLPSDFSTAIIRGQGGEDDYVSASVKDGIFWHPAVRLGERKIVELTGTYYRTLGRDTHHYYKLGAKSITVNIKTPGVYFAGAYKYVKLDDESKFELRPIKSGAPSEKEMLKTILRELEISNRRMFDFPRQVDMIKKRIAALP